MASRSPCRLAGVEQLPRPVAWPCRERCHRSARQRHADHGLRRDALAAAGEAQALAGRGLDADLVRGRGPGPRPAAPSSPPGAARSSAARRRSPGRRSRSARRAAASELPRRGAGRGPSRRPASAGRWAGSGCRCRRRRSCRACASVTRVERDVGVRMAGEAQLVRDGARRTGSSGRSGAKAWTSKPSPVRQRVRAREQPLGHRQVLGQGQLHVALLAVDPADREPGRGGDRGVVGVARAPAAARCAARIAAKRKPCGVCARARPSRSPRRRRARRRPASGCRPPAGPAGRQDVGPGPPAPGRSPRPRPAAVPRRGSARGRCQLARGSPGPAAPFPAARAPPTTGGSRSSPAVACG